MNKANDLKTDIEDMHMKSFAKQQTKKIWVKIVGKENELFERFVVGCRYFVPNRLKFD